MALDGAAISTTNSRLTSTGRAGNTARVASVQENGGIRLPITANKTRIQAHSCSFPCTQRKRHELPVDLVFMRSTEQWGGLDYPD
jgi:hypothetical protein